jgi:predicted PurR-regulated permease PerM
MEYAMQKILQWLSSLFKDSDNKPSSIRVLTTFTVIVPIIAWVVYIFVNEWVPIGESIAFLILGALGSKAAQKWAENRSSNSSITGITDVTKIDSCTGSFSEFKQNNSNKIE